MKCTNCNYEFPDDYSFCPECGQACGKREEEVMERDNFVPSSPKKGKGPLIALIFATVLVIVIVAVSIVFLFAKKNKSTEVEPKTEVEEIDADYNLLENDQLTFEGTVKKSVENEYYLCWDEELSFYGKDSDGTHILLEDSQNVCIDTTSLSSELLDRLTSDQTLIMEGQIYFDNENLYMTPFDIRNVQGEDMMELLEEEDEEEMEIEANSIANSEYILPQSGSRILTYDDVSGLSLQEINYAKNEIYARHGRLFKSEELQNYFDGKSWYYGTIRPEDFQNSFLSDIESKNVEFLSDVEHGIDSDGYISDAH